MTPAEEASPVIESVPPVKAILSNGNSLVSSGDKVKLIMDTELKNIVTSLGLLASELKIHIEVVPQVFPIAGSIMEVEEVPKVAIDNDIMFNPFYII